MIKEYKQKNTWDGWKITPSFNLDGASILIQFKASPGGRAIFEYSTENGSLIIASDGTSASMKRRILDYPAGIYYTDVRITDANGRVRNFAYQQIKILQIVSY